MQNGESAQARRGGQRAKYGRPERSSGLPRYITSTSLQASASLATRLVPVMPVMPVMVAIMMVVVIVDFMLINGHASHGCRHKSPAPRL